MVVRMRHTRAQTRQRRSHHKLESPRLAKDQDGVFHLRHRINPQTGKYKGRVIIDIAGKKAAKAARKKSKENQSK